MFRTVFWTLWKRATVGWFARMALKHVYYHMWNGSPVQVWCMRQGAQGWCTGMTQRDGMGREVGGGFRMGNTCTPVADSCQCMATPLQYCKVISLQLKWINLLKKKMKVKVTQSCLTLCDPMDCIVKGILQARILEWVAFPFSRGSTQPRDQTLVSCVAGGFFISWATREAQGYWSG